MGSGESVMSTDNIFAEERKARIVEYINKYSKATVAELCDSFHVSQATIRNDLKDLSSSGLIARVHGGAIANLSVNFEQNQSEAQFHQATEKKAIAEAALKYIHEGDAIALDAGSSTFELATLLGIFHDLTVVTYDINIAHWLMENTGINIILAGGPIRQGFHYITGLTAINTIRDLHVDTAFMGANGVNPDKGLTTPKIDTADIKRIMMNNARKIVLLADSHKIGVTSFVKFADISAVDYFITDFDARQEDIIKFEQADVKVELVPAGE